MFQTNAYYIRNYICNYLITYVIYIYVIIYVSIYVIYIPHAFRAVPPPCVILACALLVRATGGYLEKTTKTIKNFNVMVRFLVVVACLNLRTSSLDSSYAICMDWCILTQLVIHFLLESKVKSLELVLFRGSRNLSRMKVRWVCQVWDLNRTHELGQGKRCLTVPDILWYTACSLATMQQWTDTMFNPMNRDRAACISTPSPVVHRDVTSAGSLLVQSPLEGD